jgi:hypothetical protein
MPVLDSPEDRPEMTQKRLMTFRQYQNALLKRGIAITADSTHADYGEMLSNKVLRTPACDLATTMRTQACRALLRKFREYHQEQVSWADPVPTRREYRDSLREEFREERESGAGSLLGRLQWLDQNEPTRGVIARVRKNLWRFLDLRVNPRRMMEVWQKELAIRVDGRAARRILGNIRTHLASLRVDPDDASPVEPVEWYEMTNMGHVICNSPGLTRDWEKIRAAYLRKVLAPVFRNYRTRLVCVASPDTTYFSIDRPYFYPIIAGERSDGSHEVTIFEGLNE